MDPSSETVHDNIPDTLWPEIPVLYPEPCDMVQGMLEALPLLDAGVAGGLLAALWPAAAAREEVKDALVLAMRRAMFGRCVGARLLAARGFMFLITRELAEDPAAPAADPCSQPSCVQAWLGFMDCVAYK